jgi:hypothetical protein
MNIICWKWWTTDGFSENGLGNERLLLFEQALYALISNKTRDDIFCVVYPNRIRCFKKCMSPVLHPSPQTRAKHVLRHYQGGYGIYSSLWELLYLQFHYRNDQGNPEMHLVEGPVSTNMRFCGTQSKAATAREHAGEHQKKQDTSWRNEKKERQNVMVGHRCPHILW